MKRLYSILCIRSYKGENHPKVLVVCETQHDEAEVLNMAARVGDTVTNISNGSEEAIFLNNYKFIDS